MDNHLFDLPRDIPIYIGRQEFVVEYARGKKVLHLGCVDEGLVEEKYRQGIWLHARLAEVTKTLWGIDIDAAGLEWMRSQGYSNLFQANIEDLSQVAEIRDQVFDLIILTEVMEHLDNPGKFLDGVRPFFRPETDFLITVPNATSLSNLLALWQGRELVHPDHNYWFSLRTLSGLLQRHGYHVARVMVYSQFDFRRSVFGSVVRRIGRIFGSTPDGESSGEQTRFSPERQGRRSPNFSGWMRVNVTTLLYRTLLGRSPFFADGLIVVAQFDEKN